MTDTSPFTIGYAVTAVCFTVAFLGLPPLILFVWQAGRRYARFLSEMESGRMRPVDLDAYRARRAAQGRGGAA